MLGHHECFARFTANREWDVSELSFAKFMRAGDAQDADIVGLPVVCSRLFRFSSFYVNKNSKIRTREGPEGQEASARPNGRIPPPSTCAAGCTTSMGVKLTDVHWCQAGANAPGREEKVELESARRA